MDVTYVLGFMYCGSVEDLLFCDPTYFIQICDLLGTPYGPVLKIVSNDAISGWAEFGTLFQPGGTVCPPYFCLPIQI